MSVLWFLVGLIVGGAASWIYAQLRVNERVEDVRQNWERKLRHAAEEVGRADAAHEETKARLREAEENLRRLEQELERLRAALRQAERAAEQASQRAQRAGAEAAAQADGEPPSSPTPSAPPQAAPTAPAGEAAPKPASAEATRRRLREIDAKLAQLPAGSTARERLLKERAALASVAAAAVASKPPRVAPSQRAADDLTQIRGIGPVIAEQLHRLGITTWQQIAALTPEEVARIDQVLAFKGRIERERWIEQARALVAARGGS